jgi:hypothetical protein
VAVINNVDESEAPRGIDHAKGVLSASFEIAVARIAVFHLPQFSWAYDEGKGVTELTPARGKAATQIKGLYTELDQLAERIGTATRASGASRAVMIPRDWVLQ